MMIRLIVGVAILAAGLCVALGASAMAAPSIDVYAALPQVDQVRIAPDSKHFAMVQPVRDRQGVAIYTVGGGSPCVFAPTDVRIDNLYWPTLDKVLVHVSYIAIYQTPGGLYEHRPRRFDKLILIDLNCANPKMVLNNLTQATETTSNVSYYGRLPNDDKHFLVGSGGRGLEIYTIDTETGRGTLTYNWSTSVVAMTRTSMFSGGTLGVVLDGRAVPRVRYAAANAAGDIAVLARPADSDNWSEVNRWSQEERDAKSMQIAGFGDDPNVVYALTRNGGDRRAPYRFDLRTKTLTPIPTSNTKNDADAFFLEPHTRRVVGVIYDTLDGMQYDWFDQKWAKIFADLKATFENSSVFITSASQDLTKFTVEVFGPEDPAGSFYIYDTVEPGISKVGSGYPAITPAEWQPRSVISYRARDGLEIPALLTLPKGSNGKNLPLVVLPHGGPEQRDYLRYFDWWPQFLASRGYAVIQPQFRGSNGRGRAFAEAGHKQWGLKMEDDLTDGVKYLAGQGTIDANKVCIFGWSYGGYAALAGATFTPEVYKCVAAGAPVANLVTMTGFAGVDCFNEDLCGWPKLVGDLTRDGERMRATSPALHADRVQAPILLLHGVNDTTVPFSQSEEMANALDKAGKKYELVRLQGDDHYLYLESSRKQVLTSLDAFLARYLK